jgi:hypothetical protein
VRYLLGILALVFVLSWALLGALGWAVFITSVTLVGGAVLGSSLLLED